MTNYPFTILEGSYKSRINDNNYLLVRLDKALSNSITIFLINESSNVSSTKKIVTFKLPFKVRLVTLAKTKDLILETLDKPKLFEILILDRIYKDYKKGYIKDLVYYTKLHAFTYPIS